MDKGWTGLSPVAVPDSVVSRRPDGTQLEVPRVRRWAPRPRERGARGGHPRSPEELQQEAGNWPREPSDSQRRAAVASPGLRDSSEDSFLTT